MNDVTVKQKVVDKIKSSNNILVTVNANPSVDELSAALGLSLFINKLDKHATALFSGETPPAISFLEPEKTFENTIDSLRDFIIALDKSKADHLRYKVEGDVVRIFITPYRTTISEDDLDFSQGDYNVEMVIAIGAKEEADLDKALSAHGRILHDATVAVLSLDGEKSELGTLNWSSKAMSSYSEMVMGIVDGLKSTKNLLDEQIATALLTGIVSATERFSNAKTNSKVMTVSAQLMSSGANQQLIATKLEEANDIPAPDEEPVEEEKDDNSDPTTLDVRGGEADEKTEEKPAEEPSPTDGGLEIEHEKPQAQEDIAEKDKPDTLDEVAAATIAKQQEEATKQAEEELAEHLATTAPVEEKPLRGAISPEQLKKMMEQKPAPSEAPLDSNAEPTLGGTLNATTEQAAEDKQRALEDDRNKVILSHGHANERRYISEEPTTQSPMSAAVDPSAQEPKVVDIFSTAPNADHINTIEPPKPVAPAPTLAELDAQHRAQTNDARDAISSALAAAPSPAEAPALGAPATVPSTETSLPPLPPLPPMPDFSTLPPLPEGMNASATVAQPNMTLPPPAPLPSQPQPMAPFNPNPVVAPAGASDPAQFKIPGQP